VTDDGHHSGLTGVFRDPSLESEFQEAVRPESSRRIRAVALISGLFMLGLGYADYVTLGTGPALALCLAVRGLTFISALRVWSLARGPVSTHALIRATLLHALLFASALFVVFATVQREMMLESTGAILLTLGIYVFLPLPMWSLLLAGIYASAGFLLTSWLFLEHTGIGFALVASQLALCNVLGGYTALRAHHSRRREWLMLREVRKREHFEELIASLSTRFISLPLAEIDRAIDSALAEIAGFAAADRSYVFEWDLENRTLSCTHEWCREGVSEGLRHLQNVPYDSFSWGVGQLQRGEMILATSLEDLPPEAEAERTLCKTYSARSLVVVPLRFGGKTIGSVGFQTVGRQLELSPDLIGVLRMVGNMIVNVIMRRRAEKELIEQKRTLQDAVTALEQSNSELQKFTHAASHDLREPLRGIASFAGLLTQRYADCLDVRGRDYLQHLIDSSRRMETLVTELSAYSSVDVRERPHETCDTQALLRDVLEDLKAPIQEVGARVHCDVLPAVEGDPVLLRQLFRALIGNAIKFHNGEAPDICVTAKPRGRKVEFAVADNGIGIEPRFARKIFNVFVRLNNVDQYPGTGLGLPLCRRIVARHHGHLWFEPNRPQGSIFHFTLPAAR
jgi:signal transduction histidine kinase